MYKENLFFWGGGGIMKIPHHTTNLLGILKIDNVFGLKIAVFTFKIIKYEWKSTYNTL